MSRKTPDSRAAAARCVLAVSRGQSLNQALGTAEQEVTQRDRGLLRELCYGSLRWHPQLAPLCRSLLAKPFKPKDQDLEALLVVGAYQLLHMGLPAHAAINSAVEATRALDKAWARGLVNAILRRIQRESTTLLAGLPESARLAQPDWLRQILQTAWGHDNASELVAASNSRPPMTLRVNPRLGTRETYQQRLQAEGIEAHPCPSVSEGLQLSQPVGIERLPGFADGAVSVQDEAAQRVAHLLNPKPGMRVLDACAAPGGKAAHLLELEPQLALTALDIDPARLQRVSETLQRLHLQADLKAADAAEPEQWWDGQPFDAILVDAPCSGTGVIRRHPDIKLLRQPADITALAARQLALLQALWPLLKPGGTLIYTTCSVLPAENRDVAESFTEWSRGSAHPWAIEADWGTEQGPFRQQLTRSDGPDGFFYARWRRG